jgi:hypothetical protein
MGTALSGNPKPTYTISLMVSKKVDPHTVKEGQYDTRAFPGETRELARIDLTGEQLNELLDTARTITGLIEE